MRRLVVAMMAALVLSVPALAQALAPKASARSMKPLTLRLLDTVIPEVRFDQVPFEQAVQFLQDMTQTNISVRWEKLKEAGVQQDVPISVLAKNQRFSVVLWMVLNYAAGSDVKLAYRMSGNLLIISTDEDLGKEVITKVYDVSDLMIRVENAERPQMQQSQGLGATGGGGGSSLFQNQQNQQRQQQNQPGERQPEMEALIRVIQATIEPDSWETTATGGGTGGVGAPGRIEAYGNLLIVTNTILVHQRLGGYITE
ncbi:MAG: hypothetical protein IPM13_05970 [Phycisphaerales bacterium]|nr:hypothetical protein [Phycisphaerales bacterium]